MDTLVIGSYNLSADDVKHRPEKVKKDLTALVARCHIIGIQEGGEAAALLTWAENTLNVGIFRGFGKHGQAATPILYRKSVGKVVKRRSYPLTPNTWVGEPGAGPNTMKAKWLNMVKFKINGRNVWVGNIHTTPSVYIESREKLAREQFADTARFMRMRRGIKFLTGDMNSEPDSPLRRPLVKAGLRSSQRVLGEKDTHGNRCIDDIYFTFDKRRVRAIKNYTVPVESDHHAYIVEFRIIPRRG